MGLPGKCFYPLQAFRSGGAEALALTLEEFFRSGWDPIVQAGVDASNLSSNVIGGGLTWQPPKPPPAKPPPTKPPAERRLYPLGDYPGRVWGQRITVPIADPAQQAFVQPKGVTVDQQPGLEFVVNARDLTYGRVCIVARSDQTKQIGSLIPQDPGLNANPTFSVLANYGKSITGTSGAFDWELHRNGTASVSDNGTTIKIERGFIQGRSGGTVEFHGYDDGTTSRNAIFRGGEGATNGSSATLRGGDVSAGGTGGQAIIRGGDTASGTGGAASLEGGDATFSNGNGGALAIRGGDAFGSGTGGAFSVRAGTSPSGTAGVLDIQSAAGATKIRLTAAANLEFGGTQGTNNTLAKFGITGLPVDSGVTDDGTTLAASRVVTVKKGASSGVAYVGGVIVQQTTSIGNVGAGEDNLHTFSVPASTLGTDGDTIEFFMGGTFTASANNKRVRAYFGATAIFDTGALAITAATSWRLEGCVIRTGAATQKAICSFSTSSATLSAYATYSAPAETLSGAVTLKTTAEATSNDDVLEEIFKVTWQPAFPS